MTGSYPTRRPPRRTIGAKGLAAAGKIKQATVGDRLRDAREAKGVDLFRVERDTKIRSKYLAALEDGEFADLPGDVYARGFLRNYASYLGLDCDEIEEDWRREAGSTAPVRGPSFAGPRPITVRRGIVFQRSHIAIVAVVLIVAIVGVYFGYQVTRFLSYPTVAVGAPDTAHVTVATGVTGYELTGTSTSGATIQISWDGQPAKTTLADETGHWSYAATLHPGANQFDITAENLDTGHASKTQQIVIEVPIITPSPPSPVVAFSSPADGATVKDGNVTVAGTSTMVSTVTVTPVYMGPPLAAGATLPPATAAPLSTLSTSPGASPSASQVASAGPVTSTGPTATPGPGPKSVGANADGTFSIPLSLAPGRWQLSISGVGTNGGSSPPVVRTVVVPYKGVNVVIQLTGGAASIYAAHDGIVDANAGVPDGWTMTIVGTKWVCINTPRSNLVFISVNGAPSVAISTLGGRHAYIDTSGVAKNVASC